ncbi:PREDICTED: uncharacterized protein LOC109329277 [Lupinus angustifolius]|uniref:uncharacterized protein LOC109329277 n=1 Tax=Lupinus angustifolius TaxID=3871 RepID=UPI00092F1621|nr:PREDICTED: uncharacterized protein LOC109329277 [Lupinus angustifolius]
MGLSDHCPIILKHRNSVLGPIPFKFNNCWLQHQIFFELVSQTLAEDGCVGRKAFIVKEKLKNLKRVLIRWNKESFGCLDTKLGDLVRDINVFDTLGEFASLDNNHILERKTLVADWWKNVNWKESLLRQKARSRWTKEGDANSSYFHAYGVEFRRLLDVQISELDDGFLAEEIKAAVWSCVGDKSLGPDGFNLNFFQACWDIIKNDIILFIQEFYLFGKLPKGLNSSFITLIPKIKNPSKTHELRPISLVGSLYKILAKILVVRLKVIMSSLISSSQSAFISDRNVLDATVVINEAIHSAKKAKDGCFLLKVDFEKAYDSVDWSFLDYMLVSFGFSEKWRLWINGCLSFTSISILVNGSPMNQFPVYKGIRQGDHMVPFIFLMVAEGFAWLVRKTRSVGLFEGYAVGSLGVEVNGGGVECKTKKQFRLKWWNPNMGHIWPFLMCLIVQILDGGRICAKFVQVSCLLVLGLRITFGGILEMKFKKAKVLEIDLVCCDVVYLDYEE